MPRKKAPYFPLYANELLNDPKTSLLDHDEIGVLVRLWSWMWVNDVKRGYLLKDKKVPITDEEIAKFLRIDSERLQKYLKKFVNGGLNKGILKRDKNNTLYSKRLANHKTKYELYEKQTETKRNRNGNQTDKKRTIREVKRSKEKLSKDINLLKSFYKERINPKGLKTFSETRFKMIKNRLKNFSVDDLKQVIINISKSKWHMDNKQTHFELLFRSDAQVEKYLNLKPTSEQISYEEKLANEQS